MKRPYLRWIQKSKRTAQAILMVVESAAKPNTPEHFYHNEMNVKSDLTQRAKVRGIIKED